MRYLMITVLVVHILSCKNAFAETNMNQCFSEKTNSAISMCLSVGYEDLERKRKIIEDDAMTFAKEYDQFSKEEKEAKRKKEEIAELERKKASSSGAAPLSFSKTDYKNGLDNFVKQYLSISNLKRSRELFEAYRDIECERQRTFLGRERYEATFAEKVCLYNLTSRRIKDIEESVK